MIDLKTKVSHRFRNNWGLKNNLRYLLYLHYCKVVSKKLSLTKQDKEIAKNVRKEGLYKIGVAPVAGLSKIVAAHFAKMTIHSSCISLPRALVQGLAEPIYHALQSVKSPVNAYYNAHFKINWIDIQKIVPGEQAKGSSFSYHVDDSPYGIAKIFIYLTDTFRNNGAFRAFNYAKTDLFIKKGILKTTQPGEVRNAYQHLITKEDEESLSIVEGNLGTAFLFDNNLVHKGTLPISDERIHISMEIMPSKRPFSLEDIKIACGREPSDFYDPRPF